MHDENTNQTEGSSSCFNGENAETRSAKYKNKCIRDLELSMVAVTKNKSRPRKRSRLPHCHNEKDEQVCIRKKCDDSCDSDGFDRSVEELLRRLKKKQDELWKKNENKARSQRRIVCGMHEVLKHLTAENIKCIIMAKNLDDNFMSGNTLTLFNKLRHSCLVNDIPMITASTKKAISRAVNKHPYICCVGIMRFEGYEDKYLDIATRWRKMPCQIGQHLDQNSIFA